MLLTGLLDYIYVPREQIKYMKCEEFLVTYYQEINNIGFYGNGAAIQFKFNDHTLSIESMNISIANSLCPSQDLSGRICITKQEAIAIAYPIIEQEKKKLFKSDTPKQIPNIDSTNYNIQVKKFIDATNKEDLQYVNFGTAHHPDVKLCWVIHHSFYVVMVNALNGDVLKHFSNISYLGYHSTGNTHSYSSSANSNDDIPFVEVTYFNSRYSDDVGQDG
jgi:hypothetical protein